MEAIIEFNMPPRPHPSISTTVDHLPDDLLLRILSFLEFPDLIQTSLVSRRWRRLWTAAPTLSFHSRLSSPAVISEALRLSAANLETLRIRSDEIFPFESWILAAKAKKIQHLDLFWISGAGVIERPSSLYSCESLESLSLRNLGLDPPPSIKLPNLKTLRLRSLNLSDAEFGVIFSGCPCLEELCLRSCNDCADLLIHAPSNSMLRHLRIEDAFRVRNRLEVSVPSLLFLTIGDQLREGYSIKNCLSLTAVSLNFEQMLCFSWYEDALYVLMGLLEDVSNVETLKLCSWCCQVLSLMEVIHNVESLNFGTTHLELNTGLHEWDLLGMTYLLRGLPHLQELVLKIDCKAYSLRKGRSGTSSVNLDYYESDESALWELLGCCFSCHLQQLKTLKIYGFLGSKDVKERELEIMAVDQFIDSDPEILLLKTLVKNCKGLEEIILKFSWRLCDVPGKIIEKLVHNLGRRLSLLFRDRVGTLTLSSARGHSLV